ncbi:putative methyltransferase [Nymphaea thermarum]|nr:putative methyltransferase [Nymphaea thermarum]
MRLHKKSVSILDCLGAIDGTHIPVWVHTSEQSRFRNKKRTLSQNVLVVVGFNMRFHYVLGGWEGSATNSRVLYSVLDNDVDSLVIPTGHRYHLSEFNAPGAQRVTCAEELFNHRHSSLRTTVERAFGLLKGRFPILKTQVLYPYRTQVAIVLATCVLHNFIIDHNPQVEQFDVDESAFDNANESTSFVNEVETTTQSIRRGSNNDLRSTITSQMFTDFQNRRNAPYDCINNQKSNQNWLRKQGEKFLFPGSGTIVSGEKDSPLKTIKPPLNDSSDMFGRIPLSKSR